MVNLFLGEDSLKRDWNLGTPSLVPEIHHFFRQYIGETTGIFFKCSDIFTLLLSTSKLSYSEQKCLIKVP